MSKFSLSAAFNAFVMMIFGVDAIYRNEEEVGVAIQQSGIPREEIFVVTKVCFQSVCVSTLMMV